MPVIKVDNQQYSLRPGPNRLGAGADADVRVGGDAALGVQAIVELGANAQAVIRRAGNGTTVRVNGIALVDPTPLIHGDKVEISGKEVLYAEDAKVGNTAYISVADIAAIARKRAGPARATTATGGRLVSLFDGKEYSIPTAGITIGRDPSAGVVVAQDEVSRRHAEIVPVEVGYEIRDHSANGAFVNGVRINKVQVLSRADVIRVGTEEFRFYADVRPTPALAPAAMAPANSSAPPPVPAPAPMVSAAAPTPVVTPPVPDAPAQTAAQRDARAVLATLEVTGSGVLRGQTYEIHVPLAHVGRGSHNDIVIQDDSVSETHAKLQRRDDGWYVVDVGSTNGTYVGGQRLVAERRLDGAPDVRFGGVKTVFRAADLPLDAVAGTRPIASADRTKVLQPAPKPRTVSPESAVEPTEPAQAISTWVWIVVALAVLGAVALFARSR